MRALVSGQVSNGCWWREPVADRQAAAWRTATDVGAWIATPPTDRDEQLPRALPWESVQASMAEIDRTTPLGQRDLAMFLLLATYGLCASNVAGLELDAILWRSGQMCSSRLKSH